MRLHSTSAFDLSVLRRLVDDPDRDFVAGQQAKVSPTGPAPTINTEAFMDISPGFPATRFYSRWEITLNSGFQQCRRLTVLC